MSVLSATDLSAALTARKRGSALRMVSKCSDRPYRRALIWRGDDGAPGRYQPHSQRRQPVRPPGDAADQVGPGNVAAPNARGLLRSCRERPRNRALSALNWVGLPLMRAIVTMSCASMTGAAESWKNFSLVDRFHETDHIGCDHSSSLTRVSQQHLGDPILVGIRFESWKRPTSWGKLAVMAPTFLHGECPNLIHSGADLMRRHVRSWRKLTRHRQPIPLVHPPKLALEDGSPK
jgi:hypothetical protein